MYRIAVGYALLLNLAIGAMAGTRALAGADRLPRTPPEAGWLGMVSWALFLAGAVLLIRSSNLALLLVSLAAIALIAGNREGADLTFVVWTLLYVASAGLIVRAEVERRSAIRRDAIHARIDEELIDVSRTDSRSPRS